MFDSLENLESKENENSVNTKTLKENHIKDEKQIAEKISEYEADRKLNEEIKVYVVRHQSFRIIR